LLTVEDAGDDEQALNPVRSAASIGAAGRQKGRLRPLGFSSARAQMSLCRSVHHPALQLSELGNRAGKCLVPKGARREA